MASSLQSGNVQHLYVPRQCPKHLFISIPFLREPNEVTATVPVGTYFKSTLAYLEEHYWLKELFGFTVHTFRI